MLSKFCILVVINIGILCTISPRLYGTIIIFFAATIYAIINHPTFVFSPVFWVLLFLAVFAETVSKLLPLVMKRYFKISPEYSIDTTICNLAGVIMTSTVLGTILGGTLWELVIGKSALHSSDSISAALKTVSLVALLRTICGIIMVILIICYVLT